MGAYGHELLTYDQRLQNNIARRRSLRTKITSLSEQMGITPFSESELEELVDRIMCASDKELVDMIDLKVLVRMFSREMAGRIRRYGRK